MIDSIISLFWQVIFLFGGLSMIYFGYKGEVPVEEVSNAKKPLTNSERIGMFSFGVISIILAFLYYQM